MTLDIAEASNTSIYNPQVAQQLLLLAGLLTVHMMAFKGLIFDFFLIHRGKILHKSRLSFEWISQSSTTNFILVDAGVEIWDCKFYKFGIQSLHMSISTDQFLQHFQGAWKVNDSFTFSNLVRLT